MNVEKVLCTTSAPSAPSNLHVDGSWSTKAFSPVYTYTNQKVGVDFHRFEKDFS